LTWTKVIAVFAVIAQYARFARFAKSEVRSIYIENPPDGKRGFYLTKAKQESEIYSKGLSIIKHLFYNMSE